MLNYMLQEQIHTFILQSIAPTLQEHGVTVALKELRGTHVLVRISGAGVACPASRAEVADTISTLIKTAFKTEIEDVEVVVETSEELINYARNYFKTKHG